MNLKKKKTVLPPDGWPAWYDGKHRSVTLANELYERLSVAEKEYGVRKEHRDIEKDAITKAK